MRYSLVLDLEVEPLALLVFSQTSSYCLGCKLVVVGLCGLMVLIMQTLKGN